MVKRKKKKKTKTKECGVLNVVIKKILYIHFKKPKRGLNINVLRYLLAAVKISVKECVLRSGTQALAEDTQCVSPDHVEKVLPQLIMDL